MKGLMNISSLCVRVFGAKLVSSEQGRRRRVFGEGGRSSTYVQKEKALISARTAPRLPSRSGMYVANARRVASKSYEEGARQEVAVETLSGA